jgi:hypothetical protein
MNNIKNKAELWEKCINLGIFSNIHKDMAPRIQSTFETVIEGFTNRKENIELLNQECIIKIREEIGKLNTFEERQKEYDTLLNNAPPAKIDFSDKVDEPIQNIESLVEITQNNRQELFKQLDTKPISNTTVNNTIIGSTPLMNSSPIINSSPLMNSSPFTNTKQINDSRLSIEQIIKSQNNILIKILETQNKILEALQNKK